MRASAENSESARLSGVWVRRTSTVAWTLAGVLSAITAVLASPGQTSALTEVLSPGLLLLALVAALLGRHGEPARGLRRRRGHRHRADLLQWNITNPSTGSATVELILFVLLQVALLVRAASLQKGTRTGGANVVDVRDASLHPTGDRLRRQVGRPGSWASS